MNKSNMNNENKTINKTESKENKTTESNNLDLSMLSNARTSIKRKITNNINEINLSWSRDTNKKEKANKTKLDTSKALGAIDVTTWSTTYTHAFTSIFHRSNNWILQTMNGHVRLVRQ